MPTPEGQAYLDLNRKMKEMDAEELRKLSPEESLLILEALYASSDVRELREAGLEDNWAVREMWARAKRKHGRNLK